jgi:enoyl-CoA hydratase/carnithine racemase
MADTSVSLERMGAAARLTLTRPAIDARMASALREACDSACADPDVRVIVLTGSGETFATGWDWQAFAGESPAALLDSLRAAGALEDPFGCFAEAPKPVVCAVNGDAVGAGLALALACDIRIAADGVRFGLPETEMGLLPVAGGTQRLSRLVGRGKALEMILTGEPVGATEALRIGLVSEVVPASELDRRALEIAERLAERGPVALQFAKEALNRGVDMPLEQGLRYETDLTIILQTTDDRAEGVRAFLEKRKPRFKGK